MKKNLILPPEKAKEIAEKLNYRHNGLITVIVQEVLTNKILMVAFANKEAVEKTLTTGMMHYWSTERKKLWLKGETSGHYQFLQEMYIDCDADSILVKVHQVGVACHLGYKSCFFRKLINGNLQTIEEKPKS
ncbi:phosphoribosyl-AMP cyclohydrolase [Candidatus Bathyarchaeota archaeon]|nr:MAG: phosphoribosyl-AMP cyclohydrolase [Candidatus Bathyarchaeota archaeon]